MSVKTNFQLIIICLLSCVIFTSCCTDEKNRIKELEDKLLEYDVPMFEGKFVTGYLISSPKFGQYGLLEMHDGEIHEESFLAIYDKKDLEGIDVAKIDGDKIDFLKTYFVRVNSFNGIPKIVEVKNNLDPSDELFHGTPITNLDYHLLSDHGNGAGWHKKGHRRISGFEQSPAPNESTLEITTISDEVKSFMVPTHLLAMARALSDNIGNGIVYYELDSLGTSYTKLDSVHRHGNIVYPEPE